jgi:hypothetical protein
VILDPDAVVQPWTVVIKALDAMSTDGAMPAATRADSLAVGTELGGVDRVKHVHKVYFIVPDEAWRRERCEQVE